MKFDTLFIKNKLLVKTLEEYTKTYQSLYDTPDIMDDKTLHFLSRKIDKLCKKDIHSINKAFRLINRQRRKWIKAGTIDTEDEMFKFMYQIGLYNPEYIDDGNSDDQEQETPEKEPSEPEEPAQECESEDKPESSTEETAKVQPETGDKGGETFLSAKEYKAEKITAKIETEK